MVALVGMGSVVNVVTVELLAVDGGYGLGVVVVDGTYA